MPFTYDARTGRYFYPDGRPVPARALREALDTVIADTQARIDRLVGQYSGGQLDPLGWRLGMRAELKLAHGIGAQVAFGGQAGMDASARGWLGARLRAEYQYLDRFALQAATGEVDKSAPSFLARAQQYARGIWATYQQGRSQQARDEGLDEVQNVLGDADHCDECTSLTDQGWIPLDAMPDPGDRQCLSNCACELEYRSAAEATAEEGAGAVGAEA